MTRSVIVSAVRTPVGKYGAGLRSLTAVDLGAVAIEAATARAGIPPTAVDWVVMGHVLQAGAGQNPARQAAIAGGVPREVPAITINNVCLSSLTALGLADQMIRAGEVETVVAGGMESMTNAPVPAADAPLGRPRRGCADGRRDDVRRAVVHVQRSGHGRVVRRGQRRARDLA